MRAQVLIAWSSDVACFCVKCASALSVTSFSCCVNAQDILARVDEKVARVEFKLNDLPDAELYEDLNARIISMEKAMSRVETSQLTVGELKASLRERDATIAELMAQINVSRRAEINRLDVIEKDTHDMRDSKRQFDEWTEQIKVCSTKTAALERAVQDAKQALRKLQATGRSDSVARTSALGFGQTRGAPKASQSILAVSSAIGKLDELKKLRASSIMSMTLAPAQPTATKDDWFSRTSTSEAFEAKELHGYRDAVESIEVDQDRVVAQCFRSFDKGKDGYLTKDEVLEALVSLNMDISEAYLDGLMQNFVSENETTTLNFSEFQRLHLFLQENR